MSLRIFTITKQIANLRKGKGSRNTCITCGGIIKIGNVVVTKIGFGKGTRPIRHEVCARRVGIID